MGRVIDPLREAEEEPGYHSREGTEEKPQPIHQRLAPRPEVEAEVVDVEVDVLLHHLR